MKIDPESLYVQLGRLVETMPDFSMSGPLPAPSLQWLGRAHALVLATGEIGDVIQLKNEIDRLKSEIFGPSAALQIAAIIYRALAVAELNAPAAARGAFIPAGNAFDALAAIGNVLQTAKKDVLIVDPYMDANALMDFAVLAPERVLLRLLADQQDHKATLEPAVRRWKAQHGASRPLEAKLAPARILHDRLIAVDGADAWTLTQSLNAFAARSPASIIRADVEVSVRKIAAYEAIWLAATPI